MAISEVASQRATNHGAHGAAQTKAFPNNVTAGNLLVCAGGAWSDASLASMSVASTRGGTFTIYVYAWNEGSDYFAVWIAIAKAATSGADTVTVTLPHTSSCNWSFHIDEFTGQDPTTPLRTDGGGATDTTTSASMSLTSTAGDLILGAIIGYAGTYSVGSGYTQIGEYEGSTDVATSSEFRLSTGNNAVTFTVPTGGWWGYRIAVRPQTLQVVTESDPVKTSESADLRKSTTVVESLGVGAIEVAGDLRGEAKTEETLRVGVGEAAALADPQVARPESDVTPDGWTPSTGVSLAACLDEEVADDADYIESGAIPDSCLLTVSALNTPMPGTTTIRFRARFLG
jgi:hypothetical protein